MRISTIFRSIYSNVYDNLKIIKYPVIKMKNLFDQIKLLYDQELYSNVARLCSLAVTICDQKPDMITLQQKCNMYIYYAESLYQLEQYSKAENIFYQAFQQRKGIIKKKSGNKPQESNKEKEIMSDIDIKFKMHLCYVKLKQFQKAICILQSIFARSRNSKINMALGNLYRDSGLERSAISAYKEVLRESPLALEAAESLLALGVKGIEVNSLMIDGTADNTTTAWLNVWLRGQAEMQSRDYRMAIPTFMAMDTYGLLKDNIPLLVTVGQCHHYNGDPKWALSTLQRAYNLDPNNTEGLDILASLLAKENPEELQNLIPPDLDLNQYCPAHWLTLAYSMYANKKYNKAAYFTQKACIMKPRNVEALLLKANILYDVKKLKDCAAHLQEALEISPYRFEIHQNLVNCYLLMHKIREAVSVASNACKQLGHTPRVLTLYASVLMKEPVTLCKAKSLLQRALQTTDNQHVFLPAVYCMIEIFDIEMTPEEAYQFLSKYIEQYPTSKMHQLLGDVLARLNKEDKAFDHYNIALNLDPNNQRAIEGMQAIGRTIGNSSSGKMDNGFYMNCEESSGNQGPPPLSDQEPDQDSDSDQWIEASFSNTV